MTERVIAQQRVSINLMEKQWTKPILFYWSKEILECFVKKICIANSLAHSKILVPKPEHIVIAIFLGLPKAY